MKKIFSFLIVIIAACKLYAQTPLNDDPCGAITVPVIENSDGCALVHYNVTGATYLTLAIPDFCGNTNPDIWYSFRALRNLTHITIFGDEIVQIYTATSCSGTFSVEIAACFGNPGEFLLNTTPGTLYYIRISNDGNFGILDFDMCISTNYPAAGQRIGINTSNPQYHLDVRGKASFKDSVQFNSGLKIGLPTAGNNKVLASDVSGNARWADINTLSAPNWIANGNNINNTNMGNVGIGTSTPTSLLNLNGQMTIDQKNFGGFGGLYIKGDGPGINYPNIAFGVKNTANNDVVAAMLQGDLVNKTAGSETIDLNFLTSTAGQGGLSSKMSIKGNGMVRIAGQQNAGTGNKSLSIGGFGDIDVDAQGTTGGRFKILENGNVGIGNSTPNGELQFGNTAINRKLVLWETANNNHQFYGLGINGGSLRYQVDNTTSAHKFYAGSSTTASDELLSINGNGSIGVNGNTGNPGQVLMSNGSNGSAVWTSAANVIKTGATESSSPIYFGLNDSSPKEFINDRLTLNITVPSRVIFYYKTIILPYTASPTGDIVKWRFETYLNGTLSTNYNINGHARPFADEKIDCTNGPDYFDLQPGTYQFSYWGQNLLVTTFLGLTVNFLAAYTIIPL